MSASNPIALRIHEISLTLEGGKMPEIVSAFDIAGREIDRLQELAYDPKTQSTWKDVAGEFISRCDTMSKKLEEAAKLEANVIAVLESLGSMAVRVREGGGPEDLAMSLAVSVVKMEREIQRLKDLINSPQINDFLEAVRLEAAHQRERWGVDHDAGKTDEDWFWLLGYLGGKALHAAKQQPDAINMATTPPTQIITKQLHHIITTAAACANWHAQRMGVNTSMRPGIAPPKGDN